MGRKSSTAVPRETRDSQEAARTWWKFKHRAVYTHIRIHDTSTWTPTNMYRNVHLYTNMPARTDTSNNKQTHAIMRKNTQNPQPNTESLLKINYKPPEDRKTNTAFKLSNIIRHDCARIIPTTSPEYNGEHTWSFTGKCAQLSRCFQPIRKLQKQISLSDIYFFLFLRGHNACFLLISHMMTFTRNNPFISCVKKKKNAHTILHLSK